MRTPYIMGYMLLKNWDDSDERWTHGYFWEEVEDQMPADGYSDSDHFRHMWE